MIKPLLAALAIVTATAVPASAATDYDYDYVGECGFDAVDNAHAADGEDVFHGVLYGYAVLYSPSAPAEPVSATVTCTLSFQDGSSFAASSSGTTVVYATEPIAFTADDPFDRAEFCQTVDFHDDGEPPRTACFEYTTEQVPPQEVVDVVDDVLATVPGARAALCAALRTAEPFVPDVWNTVMVTDDGDLYLGRYRFWDCP